jgi:hypothetical protein
MFIANLNVFIALVAGASYLFMWFFEVSVPMLVNPKGDAFMVFCGGYLLVALALISTWIKWGLVPIVPGPGWRTCCLAGHGLLALASVVLVGGIGKSFQMASMSKEDQYWFMLALVFDIGPAAAILAAIGGGLIFISARAPRPRRA